MLLDSTWFSSFSKYVAIFEQMCEAFRLKKCFFTVVMLMTVWYVKVMFDDFSVALKRLPEKAV